MEGGKALKAEQLRKTCDPSGLGFRSTEDLADLDEILGQDRALAALEFGLRIGRDGYNVYALGPEGVGRHTVVRRLIDRHAATMPVPLDWCYVFSFGDPARPRAIELPAGRGAALRHDMDVLVEELKVAIPAAFESDDFRTRRQAIDEEAKHRQEEAFQALQEDAEARSIALVRTPVGMALTPVKNGRPIDPEAFNALSEDRRRKIQQDLEKLQGRLEEILRQMPLWDRERRGKIRELAREVTTFAVQHLIDELRESYAELAEVRAYLDEVQADVIESADMFLQQGIGPPMPPGMPQPLGEGGPSLRRYRVNLLVDNAQTKGAPVVYEDHPTVQNLIGRVEHISQFGALVTDFTLIRSGALHRANGGFLVLDARRVLLQPFAWEELKRVLRARQLRIESLGQSLGLVSTVSLEPEPIPLDVRVILVGDRRLYYLLSLLDPDFAELFKVPADFGEDLDWTADNTARYARLVATMARDSALLPLDAGAVARVIEDAARRSADTEKLSVHARQLMDLLRESDYWAREAGAGRVSTDHVQRALDAQIYRSDRVRERIYEQIRRGILMVDVAGEAVGQVNGLSVLDMGGFMFGRPSRITARARLGRGQVVDVERKVELGGPLHSKGVLILHAFLAARYALDVPLSLSASLVFEQSYGPVEGDSASSAELYALLSVLADVPIRQSLAVTGSVNQLGRVQAIGGVNEKVEGFFDVCSAAGLSGDQGVLIPSANVAHLMLRADVVEAAAAGRFHVYAVETIDQGIEILTGLAAGERGPDGSFPADTINGRVEAKLVGYADAARKYAARAEQGKEPS
jgi:lon-related putative ATP-dependent protease